MDKQYKENSESLRHQYSSQRKNRLRNMNHLLIRNILNVVFILMAIIAMAGIWLYPEYTNQFYILCLIAVCIKMVEVMFRMPGMKK